LELTYIVEFKTFDFKTFDGENEKENKGATLRKVSQKF